MIGSYSNIFSSSSFKFKVSNSSKILTLLLKAKITSSNEICAKVTNKCQIMQLQSPSFLWISSSVPKNSRLVHLEHYQVPRTKIDWFWLKMYQKKRCLMGLEPLQGIFSNILLTMNKDFQEAKKSYCIEYQN